MMIKVGFTGTQEGMTLYQKANLEIYLRIIFVPGAEFHNGCCIGADDESAVIAKNIGFRTVGHPPLNQYKMNSFVYDELREPTEFLKRDKIIVDETNPIVACPKTDHEVLRSGTWATIRYCRGKYDLVKHLNIIWPYGDDYE